MIMLGIVSWIMPKSNGKINQQEKKKHDLRHTK